MKAVEEEVKKVADVHRRRRMAEAIDIEMRAALPPIGARMTLHVYRRTPRGSAQVEGVLMGHYAHGFRLMLNEGYGEFFTYRELFAAHARYGGAAALGPRDFVLRVQAVRGGLIRRYVPARFQEIERKRDAGYVLV